MRHIKEYGVFMRTIRSKKEKTIILYATCYDNIKIILNHLTLSLVSIFESTLNIFSQEENYKLLLLLQDNTFYIYNILQRQRMRAYFLP